MDYKKLYEYLLELYRMKIEDAESWKEEAYYYREFLTKNILGDSSGEYEPIREVMKKESIGTIALKFDLICSLN
jgi:hypothetical protein